MELALEIYQRFHQANLIDKAGTALTYLLGAAMIGKGATCDIEKDEPIHDMLVEMFEKSHPIWDVVRVGK